jgi:hypothetical protein
MKAADYVTEKSAASIFRRNPSVLTLKAADSKVFSENVFLPEHGGS